MIASDSMNRHRNMRTILPFISLYFLLPSYAFADDMGGIQNPLMLMLIGAAFTIFFLVPVIAWLVAMKILKRKIVNRNDYVSIKITTFWAEFASGATGFFIVIFQGLESWYSALGFSLPALSAIALLVYAVVRKS